MNRIVGSLEACCYHSIVHHRSAVQNLAMTRVMLANRDAVGLQWLRDRLLGLSDYARNALFESVWSFDLPNEEDPLFHPVDGFGLVLRHDFVLASAFRNISHHAADEAANKVLRDSAARVNTAIECQDYASYSNMGICDEMVSALGPNHPAVIDLFANECMVKTSLMNVDLWYLWAAEEIDEAPRWFRAFLNLAVDDLRFPSVVRPMARAAVEMSRKTSVDDHGRMTLRGVPTSIQPMPMVTADLVKTTLNSGLAIIDTPFADDVLGWLLTQGFLLDITSRIIPTTLSSYQFYKDVEGGYGGIAIALGKMRGTPSKTVRQVLETLSLLTLGWRNARERVDPLPLIHLVHRPRNGPTAALSIGLHCAFTPRMANMMQGSDKLLVPWIDRPSSIDRLNTRHQSAATRMWRLLRIELAQCSIDIHSQGSARIDFKQLADEAGVPAKILDGLIESWTSEGQPLERTHRDRFSVRDPLALAMLRDSGAIRIRQRRRGLKAQTKKKAAPQGF